MTEIMVRMVPSGRVGPIPATRSHFVYEILTFPKFVTLMSLNCDTMSTDTMATPICHVPVPITMTWSHSNINNTQQQCLAYFFSLSLFFYHLGQTLTGTFLSFHFFLFWSRRAFFWHLHAFQAFFGLRFLRWQICHRSASTTPWHGHGIQCRPTAEPPTAQQVGKDQVTGSSAIQYHRVECWAGFEPLEDVQAEIWHMDD